MSTELAYEQIKDNYWYAAYGPFRVIMDKNNGYINATEMCSSNGKEYKQWAALKSSRQLIRAARKMGSTPPTKKVNPSNATDVELLIGGTYCHPDLIPSIACWISPKYAIEVFSPFVTEAIRAGIL